MYLQLIKRIKEKNEALRKIVLPELELLYSQIAGTNFMVLFRRNGLVLIQFMKNLSSNDVGKLLYQDLYGLRRFVVQMV
ncbi:MAG: hypothetical protein CM1200mP13_02730 [Candidatus Pelagibacterales bacterium]|nr:MAG: hypothetical protein CM1200mP13_02730 [Pelagibacterales bacterium]